MEYTLKAHSSSTPPEWRPEKEEWPPLVYRNHQYGDEPEYITFQRIDVRQGDIFWSVYKDIKSGRVMPEHEFVRIVEEGSLELIALEKDLSQYSPSRQAEVLAALAA